MRKNISEKKRGKYMGRSGLSQQFLGIPYFILKSSEFAALDGGELKFLIDLAGQFDGSNNGNFDVTQLEMRWSESGKPERVGTAELKPASFPGARWNSERKKRRCLRGLTQKGWILKTKQGGFGMGPNLYALTWWPIDPCEGKHDYPPEKAASHLWRKKKDAGPETGVLKGPEMGPGQKPKTASNGPETGRLRPLKKAA